MKGLLLILILSPDTIRFKDPKKAAIDGCTIIKADAKGVVYKDSAGKDKMEKTDDIEEIIIQIKPPSYLDGERLAADGEIEAAVEKFEATKKATNNQFLQQLCLKSIAECYLRWGKLEKGLEALKKLRSEYKEGFFLFESFKMSWANGRMLGSTGGNEKELNKVIDDLSSSGKSLLKGNWEALAEVFRGMLREDKREYDKALQIYDKYKTSNHYDVRDEATAGRFRCLVYTNRVSDAKNDAGKVIKDKTYGVKALVAAHNALGEAWLQKNEVMNALLEFMWGVCFNPGYCQDHEISLGKSAICMAKYAKQNKEKDAEYRHRAQTLHAELSKSYPNSPLIDQIEKELR